VASVTYGDMISHALTVLPDGKVRGCRWFVHRFGVVLTDAAHTQGTFKQICDFVEKQYESQLNWKLERCVGSVSNDGSGHLTRLTTPWNGQRPAQVARVEVIGAQDPLLQHALPQAPGRQGPLLPGRLSFRVQPVVGAPCTVPRCLCQCASRVASRYTKY
jgi:hypothetical protein